MWLVTVRKVTSGMKVREIEMRTIFCRRRIMAKEYAESDIVLELATVSE